MIKPSNLVTSSNIMHYPLQLLCRIFIFPHLHYILQNGIFRSQVSYNFFLKSNSMKKYITDHQSDDGLLYHSIVPFVMRKGYSFKFFLNVKMTFMKTVQIQNGKLSEIILKCSAHNIEVM